MIFVPLKLHCCWRNGCISFTGSPPNQDTKWYSKMNIIDATGCERFKNLKPIEKKLVIFLYFETHRNRASLLTLLVFALWTANRAPCRTGRHRVHGATERWLRLEERHACRCVILVVLITLILALPNAVFMGHVRTEFGIWCIAQKDQYGTQVARWTQVNNWVNQFSLNWLVTVHFALAVK